MMKNKNKFKTKRLKTVRKALRECMKLRNSS